MSSKPERSPEEDENARHFSGGRNELSPLARKLTSRFIRFVVSPGRRNAERSIRERLRRLAGRRHVVDYYHQVDDPYAQLAAQTLDALCRRYDIEIAPHLVSAATDANIPEPELLARLARRDCAAVAPHYGLQFTDAGANPKPEAVSRVERALTAVLRDEPTRFAERAAALGRALWGGDGPTLHAELGELSLADETATRSALEEGTERRRRGGHYSGAMFHYAGEWYWGVDRLHHLERRLASLGADRETGELLFARPTIPMERAPRAAEMTLEVFPSLRSPYTAIAFEKTLELAERTGVELIVRPVLPMVMRDVPVPMVKGLYIMMDTKRESETLGVPFGKLLDPIGDPVRRAYSLWPWANEIGRGPALLASFVRGAFMEAIDTSTEAGFRQVIERAGLDWSEASKRVGDPAWETEIEANRLAMVEEMGQWGVPSYRLRGPGDAPELCCWGQDRIWLIAREIQERGGA
jgi:2-hydroxychromene-2-carboxylate isomerase